MAITANFFTGADRESVGAVQALRKRIFIDQHGWALPETDGREIDEFDVDSAIHLAIADRGRLCGTFRATRTDHPYLGAIVFPQLAVTEAYPDSADIWEISRFGVLGDGNEIGLSHLAYALMFWFADRVAARSLVAIADLKYERFLRAMSVRTRRYGPAQSIGTDRHGRELRCVAGEIPIALQDSRRLSAFANLLTNVEITDASHVLGSSRLPA